MTANPAVQILFEVEGAPSDGRMARVDGTATVRTDPEVQERYRSAVARKYVITPRGLWNMAVHPRQWGPLRRHVSSDAGCVLDVTVTGVAWLTRPGAQPR